MEQFGPLFTVAGVLMLLGASLYFLKRKGIARVGFKAGGLTSGRQLQSIERLPLTPQHSLHLIRVYGRTVLIAVSPGGCSVLDGSAWTNAAEEKALAR
jgi:LPXTG-motif cell wall-anchored protein